MYKDMAAVPSGGGVIVKIGYIKGKTMYCYLLVVLHEQELGFLSQQEKLTCSRNCNGK
jgi:hypothetical protein